MALLLSLHVLHITSTQIIHTKIAAARVFVFCMASAESHLRALVCWEFGSVKRRCLGSAEQRKNCKTKRRFSFFLHSLCPVFSVSLRVYIPALVRHKADNGVEMEYFKG